ncbi:MAG TPA: DUF5684 domain-containing protein [Candidatus Acidoferrales bacterium]|nr:DUF5684 domain-containing protein [Candidatus Acidoferrales bacterium]
MTIGQETVLIMVLMALWGYLSFSVQVIARRTDTPNDWFAWIPIANLFLICAIAKKPLWWFFWMLVPLANIVVLVILWMRMAEARDKPSWWGLLTLIPVVSLIVPGYLAFSD